MPAQCDICQKTLSDKKSLKKHKRAIHQVYPGRTNIYGCADCGSQHQSLNEMASHMQESHQANVQKLCHYCNMVFSSVESHRAHALNKHGLPIWTKDNGQSCSTMPRSSKLVESVFNGTGKVFEISGDEDGHVYDDVLEFLMAKKSEIEEMLRNELIESPLKVQLLLTLSLSKPSPDNEQREKLTIHLNSNLTPVFYNGLDIETYYSMMDQIASNLIVFSSQGSGWVVDQIDKLTIRTCKFSPIRASSYLPLPEELRGRRGENSMLLNIRNHDDEKCFLYSFTAGYHLAMGGNIYPENANWRMKSNPKTYGPDNIAAHQAVGTYNMPMSLSEIPMFEKNNNVQVNIFR